MTGCYICCTNHVFLRIKHMEITCHYTCDTRKLIVIPYEKLEDQLGYKSPNF